MTSITMTGFSLIRQKLLAIFCLLNLQESDSNETFTQAFIQSTVKKIKIPSTVRSRFKKDFGSGQKVS